jgi:hypothetical protein
MARGLSLQEKLDSAADAVLEAGRRLIYQLKFEEDQPRVPAGEPGGGRWTSGTSDLGSEGIFAMAERLKLAGGSADYQACLDLCYPLLERPEHPSSDRNMWDFHKCMNACLGRN